MPDQCPVCETALKESARNWEGRDATFFSCDLCGDFILSGTLIEGLKNTLLLAQDAKAKISHAIRMMQRSNPHPELYTNTVYEILKRPLPTPHEQADLLIRWIGENIGGPGESILVDPRAQCSIIGAKSAEGLLFILNYLFHDGFILEDKSKKYDQLYGAIVTLSFNGWSRYEQLRRGGVSYRKAFMAMKFGEATLEDLFENIFKPYVGQTGFELFCLKDRPVAGLIDNRLRVEIQAADFLIADLTHENPGAYFEAGYAEGLGKPVIYTCEKGKFESLKTHFDTNHHLTIKWDESSPQSAGEELKACIRATLPHLAKQEDN